MQCLRVIDKAIKDINRLGKTTMCDISIALHQQRNKLIEENACYYDADRFIKTYKGIKIESE